MLVVSQALQVVRAHLVRRDRLGKKDTRERRVSKEWYCIVIQFQFNIFLSTTSRLNRQLPFSLSTWSFVLLVCLSFLFVCQFKSFVVILSVWLRHSSTSHGLSGLYLHAQFCSMFKALQYNLWLIRTVPPYTILFYV